MCTNIERNFLLVLIIILVLQRVKANPKLQNITVKIEITCGNNLKTLIVNKNVKTLKITVLVVFNMLLILS
jgi:hypothetical protein